MLLCCFVVSFVLLLKILLLCLDFYFWCCLFSLARDRRAWHWMKKEVGVTWEKLNKENNIIKIYNMENFKFKRFLDHFTFFRYSTNIVVPLWDTEINFIIWYDFLSDGTPILVGFIWVRILNFIVPLLHSLSFT